MHHRYEPKDRSKPGDTLREALAALDLTPSRLASKTGMPSRQVRALLASQIAITPQTATKLETALGTPAAFWLRLDANYRNSITPSQPHIMPILLLCVLCVLCG